MNNRISIKKKNDLFYIMKAINACIEGPYRYLTPINNNQHQELNGLPILS